MLTCLTEADRIKDQDQIITNYRLAISKMKNQIGTLKLAIDQHHNDKLGLKGELEQVKVTNSELQQSVDLLTRQLQEAEHHKKNLEISKKKLVNEEITKYKAENAQLEDTVAHQKEV
jgi:hypothetical protein